MPVENLDKSDLPERSIFMTLPAVLGPNEQSFEELRTADYLKAYIASGKPPPPCPPLPTGDRERTELGLPPLFKPHIEVGPSALTTSAVPGPDSPSGTRSGGGRAQVVLDVGSLPAAQAFRTTRVGGAEVHQSLASQTEFANFSHEELRCHAYAKGSKYPPTPLPLDQSPASALPAQARSTVVPRTTSPVLPNLDEVMQSLSAASPYLQHSVEELRLAFLQSGRELTSAEIFQFKPPMPTGAAALPLTQPSLLASTSGYTFSQPPPVRPL